MKRWLFALAAACASAAEERRLPDPADPKAPVPHARYESAFVGFRGVTDDKPAPWKQVNKEVEGAGMQTGHAPAKPEPQGTPPKEADAAKKPDAASNPAHRH